MKFDFLLPVWIAILLAGSAAFSPNANAFKEPSHPALLDYDARKGRPEQPLPRDRAAAVAQLLSGLDGRP